MRIVALIPARAGSKRIPDKNIKWLGGKPLIQWTIEAAKASGIFQAIIVCSDDLRALWIAHTSGVDSHRRPAASDDEPDIAWVRRVLHGRDEEAFSILRPTSPFRTAETIRRAWDRFRESGAHSLRAVDRWHGPHPGKMWTYGATTDRLYPVMPEWTAHAPYHSSPTQSLEPVYVQNASLEMAWTRTVWEMNTIAGTDVLPFFTDGWEGFDINTTEDWEKVEAHASTLLARV